jgi:hypothetical protein
VLASWASIFGNRHAPAATKLVDGNLGVHVMIPKQILGAAAR